MGSDFFMKLEAYPNFSPFQVRDFVQAGGWEAEIIRVSNVDLRTTQKGAALECGDGRSDSLPNRKKYGPRILGGIHAVSALVTGGTRVGRARGIELTKESGYFPGTHGAEYEGEGCGAFGLLKNRKVPVPFPLEDIPTIDEIKAEMEQAGGMHVKLPGLHIEKAVIYNPFPDTTIKGTGERFIEDDWFLDRVGASWLGRIIYMMKIVEQLKPDAKKLEILIP